MRKWDSRLILWCQKSISEWFENLVNLGLKKELGLTPPRPVRTMSPFFTVFFVGDRPLSIYFNLNYMIWYVLPFRLTTLGVLLLRCLNYLINLKISKEIRANKGWVWGSLLWWLHCLRSTEEHLQPGQSSVSSLHRDTAVQHCASNRCEQIHIDHVEPVLNCCWIQ